MSDYTFEAIVRLRVKDEEDFIEAAERAEEFFYQGLSSLAYSDDPDDDHYEIEGVNIDWGAAREW